MKNPVVFPQKPLEMNLKCWRRGGEEVEMRLMGDRGGDEPGRAE
jgi:hypothetical protein